MSKKKILAKGQAQHLAHASIANQAHVCSYIFIYFFKKIYLTSYDLILIIPCLHNLKNYKINIFFNLMRCSSYKLQLITHKTT